MDTARASFGRLLRQGRRLRGQTQQALALQADVSARHLSWLETGRAEPSRAMVLRLAEQLDVPLRERNRWLAAAGYAPLYAERALDDPALASARRALQRLLAALEPSPALAVDRHWNLVAHNRLVPLLIAHAGAALLQPPVNLLRLSLHPQGLAPAIENLPAWRQHVLHRLARQAAAAADPVLGALWQELKALPPPSLRPARGADAPDASAAADAAADWPASTDDPATEHPDVLVPLALRTPFGSLRFLTMLTVFGAPRDVTLSELALETLLPADEATAATLRQMLAAV
jgi:transcriptional regulator with XRE-family HTH domain